ncbi:MAG: hypothetical protein CSA29_01810 [Desulfobacterales bacterium]|nr:MAG: hypothetical protein CSA29_01810 [Desulfobacterales bacterium]
MADLIKKETGITPELIPGSGGIYDIMADNTVVYSKHATGKFPENNEIIDTLKGLTI